MAVAVSGCTSVAPPELPAPPVPAWRHAGTLAADALAPDLAHWWKTFGDPQLDALVEQALAQNLNLAQARSRVRQARMLAGRERAQFLPAVTANAHTLQDVSATDAYFHASLDASWELGLFGARESADLNAKASVDAALGAEQAARVAAIAEVVRHYLELRTAQQQLAVLERMQGLDERALQLIELRRRYRLGVAEDFELATARRAQTGAQITQLQQNAAQTRQALAVLMGQATPDPAWDVVAAPPALGPFRLEQMPVDLVRFRPEIRQAEAEVSRAAADLGMARADLYPRLSLGASYLYAYNITQNRRTVNDIRPTLGPVLDIPLFDWGRRTMMVDVRQDALDASVLGYRQAVLEGIAEAESALIALARQGEREAQMRQARDALARRNAAQARLSSLGLASEFDQQLGARALLQGELELGAAQAGRSLAFVALYKSLGGAPLPSAEAGSAAPAAQATQAQGVAR